MYHLEKHETLLRNAIFALVIFDCLKKSRRKYIMKIGLFFGSTTGNTEYAADLVAKYFGEGLVADSIERLTIEKANTFDILILGISTWNIGQLEMTWEEFFPKLDKIDFKAKKVALFGMGDQSNYPDTYLDALGILRNKLVERGAEIIGNWTTEGYNYSESLAVHNGKFDGLALDQDNQPDLTEERIIEWVKEIRQEISQRPTSVTS